MAKFDMAEGLFMSPEDVQAAQRDKITSMLASDPALGRGMLVGSNLARAMGGKTQEEVAAMANQRAMSQMGSSPESIRSAAQKMREAGNIKGAMVLEEKAANEEARLMQLAVGQSSLDTAALQRKQLSAQMKASEDALALASAQKAKGIEILTSMGRKDLAGFVDAGLPMDKALELVSKKVEPIKMKVGDGKEVLIDPTTYETVWEPSSVRPSGTQQYSILPVEEVKALAKQHNTDLTGAIIERNNDNGQLTFKKQPNKPPEGLRDQYDVEVMEDGTEVWTPKKGTPAYIEQQERKEQMKAKREEGLALSRKIHADVTNAMSTADDAMAMIEQNVAVGGIGSVLGLMPGTIQADFEAKIDTLKGGKSLEAYRAAKEAGVTFGSTTQAEWDLLARQAQNLDPKQRRPQLMAQLEAFKAQQMNALIALVDEVPTEELKAIGLGNLEYLRGKPRVTADTYPQANAYFNAKNKVAEDSRKAENAWAIEGTTQEAAPKSIDALMQEVNSWQFQ